MRISTGLRFGHVCFFGRLTLGLAILCCFHSLTAVDFGIATALRTSCGWQRAILEQNSHYINPSAAGFRRTNEK
jgi:hypothetical protein